jgi:hypothetical protein
MNRYVLRGLTGSVKATRLLRLAGCLIPALSLGGVAGAQTVAELPLQRGFYVSQKAACGSASNATLLLVTRDGINSARIIAKFRKIDRKGPTTYVVSEVQQDLDGRSLGPAETVTYEVPNQTTFKLTNSFGSFEYRFCPQNTLPSPWRNNDISAIIR